MSKHPSAELKEVSIPSTSDITTGIDNTKGAIEDELQKRGKYSKEYKVGKDTEAFLESTKQFLEEKNKGDLVQKFVHDANKATDELTQLFKEHPYFIQKHKALLAKHQAIDFANMAKQNLSVMRDLLLTLINSSEFRSLLGDLLSLIQDSFKQEASKAPTLKPQISSTDTKTEMAVEAVQKAGEVYDYGKQVVSDVKTGNIPMNEEKKKEVRDKFNAIITKISKDTNFANSINGMFYLFDQVQFFAYRLKNEAKSEAENIQTPSLNAMWSDAQQFLINFVGEEVINMMVTDFNELYETISSDTLLMNYLTELRDFLVDALKKPDTINSYEMNQKWDDLYLRGQEYLNDDKYSASFKKLSLDIRVLIDSFKTDIASNQLAVDASKLAKDLFLDETGKPSLNIMSTGLSNLRSLVAPILKKNLENVPLPGVSGEDETYKWDIQSLILNMSDLVPDNIEMRVWGAANVSLATQDAEAATYITMWIKNVGVEAKDLKFQFQRKVFPKIEDKGVADVSVTGKNQLKIVWKIAGKQDENWTFAIHQVSCSIPSLDITVKKSEHSFLMKMLTTLFSGSLRHSIENKIESEIKESLGTVNDQLNSVVKS